MADYPDNKFRSLVPLIKEQFPAFVNDADSMLPDFMEAYYEWMEQTGGPTEIINSAVVSYDINQSFERFLTEFSDEYLNNIPSSVLADKPTLMKNIRDFYRAKGSLKSIKLLFRILFGEDIDIVETSKQVLKPSDGNWIKKTICRTETLDEDFFTLVNRRVQFEYQKVNLTDQSSGNFSVGELVDAKDSQGTVYGTGTVHSIGSGYIYITDYDLIFDSGFDVEGRTSGTTAESTGANDESQNAFIEEVLNYAIGGTDVYEFTLSGLEVPVTYGLTARTLDNNDTYPEITFENSPMVVGYTINDPGTGYSVDESISLDSAGSGTGFVATVESIQTLQKTFPGTFAAVSALPSAVIEYTADDTETIQDYVAPGEFIRIDGDRYEVQSIDRANQRLTTTTNITSGTAFETVVRSYNGDTQEIASITINNPGVSYETALH